MKTDQCPYCHRLPGNQDSCQNCGAPNPDLLPEGSFAQICARESLANAHKNPVVKKAIARIHEAVQNGFFRAEVPFSLEDGPALGDLRRNAETYFNQIGFNARDEGDKYGLIIHWR